MFEGDLDGLLVVQTKFFDGFVSLFEVPFDLDILARSVIDFHDPQ